MSELNRIKANQIATELLSRANPAGMDEDAEAFQGAQVTELFEELDQQGIQLSSLSESDLRSHCRRLGMREAQITAAIEEWASWAVTDDI